MTKAFSFEIKELACENRTLPKSDVFPKRPWKSSRMSFKILGFETHGEGQLRDWGSWFTEVRDTEQPAAEMLSVQVSETLPAKPRDVNVRA